MLGDAVFLSLSDIFSASGKSALCDFAGESVYFPFGTSRCLKHLGVTFRTAGF